MFLARTLGIDELVVAVNKMDRVEFDEDRYRVVVDETRDLIEQVRFETAAVSFIPISALHGENVAEPSSEMAWYDGRTVLAALNELPMPEPPTAAALRLPIQDVYTISGVGTITVGRVETGRMRPGDDVVFQPSDVGGEVRSIEMHHEEVDVADPGDNVGFNVIGVGKEDVRRGDVVGPVDDPPSVAETFQARIVVLQHPNAITPGYTPVFHAHTAQVAGTVESLDERIDSSTGEVVEADRSTSRLAMRRR